MSGEIYHKNKIFCILICIACTCIVSNILLQIQYTHFFSNYITFRTIIIPNTCNIAFVPLDLVGDCFWSVIPRMKQAMESCVGSCCRISRLGAFKSSPMTNSQINPVFVLTVSNNGSMSFRIRSWSVDGRCRRVFWGTSTTPKSSKTISRSGKSFFEYALAIPDIVALSTYRT